MITINFKGVNLDIYGELVPYIPARVNCLPEDATPQEGGFFDLEYIEHNGDDVTELLEDYHENLNILAYEEYEENG